MSSRAREEIVRPRLLRRRVFLAASQPAPNESSAGLDTASKLRPDDTDVRRRPDGAARPRERLARMRGEVLITLVAGVVLAACEHQPPVQEMSNGEFSLTATSSSSGYGGSRRLAVQKANTYCGRSGQRAATASLSDKAELGPNGEHSSTIIFTCATPASPL